MTYKIAMVILEWFSRSCIISHTLDGRGGRGGQRGGWGEECDAWGGGVEGEGVIKRKLARAFCD